MSKNKELVKAHSRAPRFRENTRLMRVHESMVDFLKGGPPSGSLLDVVASSFFGLDILNIDEENDLIYSDDDDDEAPPQDPYKQLEPHPRIKQLTDEEADKQAKELIEEEERKGRNKKKNKHKKLRKKEKKRLKKENAEKNSLPEEEQEKSDSSESPEENRIVEKKTESKEKESTAVSDKTGTESGRDEISKIDKEIGEPEKKNKDREEATENTELNTSHPSNTESAAEETHHYTQETKEKSKTVEDEEAKTKVTEEPEGGKKKEKVHMKKEMKMDVIKENTELNTSYPSNTESAAEETHHYTQETKEKSKMVEDEEAKTKVTEEPEGGKKKEKVHMKKGRKYVIKENTELNTSHPSNTESAAEETHHYKLENKEKSKTVEEQEEKTEVTEEPEGGKKEKVQMKKGRKQNVIKENTELNTSHPSNTELAAEATHQYTQETKEKSKTVEDEEERTGVTEEPEAGKKERVQMKKEMKQDVIKEEPMDPAVLEFAQRSRDLAAVGNRLAAAGQYEMAVKYFTDAIKYNPRETRLFGNRSLCYERMHQYENALSDADVALTMEPNWTKGLFRKGKALCGLKKYYEASLVYNDVLKLDSSSKEAMQELKRAQTLHLMEMGFTWAQSCDALKTHATLEEAVEALFCGGHSLASGGAGAGADSTVWRPTQEDGGAETEWTVQQASRPRTQHTKESSSQNQATPVPKSSTKPQVFSVWVGSMAPTITYTILHEVFSRAGNVCSIKMLLEHKCAFVNYAKKQDSDRAIQCINGMVVEGVPLLVRYPSRNHTGLSVPKWATGDPSAQSGSGMYKKECFFWRTTGCNRDDCIYRHVPEHKGLDKDKFTSGLGTTFT
ncbi:sperm-associated antigen 1 isoform X1 [Sphaeramia orbicularis]|uniref:Stress-induced-phosphoprotein 1-like n=1 Tax=Sphaeramia orbicularis TaxID=375764 RepID=A0A673C1J8_9TELE|nr:sperm-associated antigen 1-like isoform X1 [Sphaeramia orbicularis]